ncbi:hypothetical protein OIE66_13925 [Nonomuraea sp. NBC_01738]|uniref:hypothetical protein n=1 Tax=Nonomuraea sp. NBC_01738 TaxID=2976003 RepID=UPI002E101881|nr:hypothetical protein OIE66_13925 [Nonomuraea sp. NBC_01738]
MNVRKGRQGSGTAETRPSPAVVASGRRRAAPHVLAALALLVGVVALGRDFGEWTWGDVFGGRATPAVSATPTPRPAKPPAKKHTGGGERAPQRPEVAPVEPTGDRRSPSPSPTPQPVPSSGESPGPETTRPATEEPPGSGQGGESPAAPPSGSALPEHG